MTSNSFDANNRASAWNGTALTYDANGNLLGFQGDSYAWNSRDELAGITGTGSAAFQYDALGRRQAGRRSASRDVMTVDSTTARR